MLSTIDSLSMRYNEGVTLLRSAPSDAVKQRVCCMLLSEVVSLFDHEDHRSSCWRISWRGWCKWEEGPVDVLITCLIRYIIGATIGVQSLSVPSVRGQASAQFMPCFRRTSGCAHALCPAQEIMDADLSRRVLVVRERCAVCVCIVRSRVRRAVS